MQRIVAAATTTKAAKIAAALMLACTAFVVFAGAAHSAAVSPALADLLTARKRTLQRMHVRAPTSLEITGSIEGAGLSGSFHTWMQGAQARDDESIGPRFQSAIRVGDRRYAVDDNGNVRELNGLLQQRGRTQEFIDGDRFALQPQYDTLAGPVQLPDGRAAYAIAVAPPGGLPETVDLDATTLMVDRLSYDDEDGTFTTDYYDYRVFAGALVAQREIDSNGDRGFDLQRTTAHITVDRRIASATFAVPDNTEIQAAVPVTVPLQEHDGHYYTRVRIHGREYSFLVDTGAQAIVLDTHVARELGLKNEGNLEVSGAQRTGGLGIAPLDALQIGTATLPLHLVTVFDLRNVTGIFQADGVLGYPFFASAEVTFDAAAKRMTIAKPGSLHPAGVPFAVDVDRELAEIPGKVNGVGGRFVLDTGNSSELLLFAPFLKDHPGIIPAGERQFAANRGAGGSVQALTAVVDELDFGSYRFFNRASNLMLTNKGAFADRFDAGNIGMGVLSNLVVTFDLANAKAYSSRSGTFDDGRYRPRSETLTIPF